MRDGFPRSNQKVSQKQPAAANSRGHHKQISSSCQLRVLQHHGIELESPRLSIVGIPLKGGQCANNAWRGCTPSLGARYVVGTLIAVGLSRGNGCHNQAWVGCHNQAWNGRHKQSPQHTCMYIVSYTTLPHPCTSTCFDDIARHEVFPSHH